MTIRNLNSLMRKLERLGGDKTALINGIRKATMKVQGDAKLLAPVNDGQLRNSIKAETKEEGGNVVGRVFTNLEYAAYVEYGTGQRGEDSPSPPKSPEDIYHRQDWTGMPAQPYLYPAARENKETASKLVAKEIKKEIQKLAGRRR
ncbi:HK97-gp10 family putative phage morphogenesis protein [Cohnella suwonensis]|uniref:HK97-gp10 family putative phage morphogenesis protein n=1 Tax=Cohnella suwonensis TaxID=696072 RepID=A0ABW0LRG4_9BACL